MQIELNGDEVEGQKKCLPKTGANDGQGNNQQGLEGTPASPK